MDRACASIGWVTVTFTGPRRTVAMVSLGAVCGLLGAELLTRARRCGFQREHVDNDLLLC